MADIGSLIFKYGLASRVLDRDESRECAKLVEIIKKRLWDKADAFIKTYSGQPMLHSYSSDGTPMTTVSRYTKKVGGGERLIKRDGGALHEFLVQRGFLKVKLASGGADACALVSDPVMLDHGKSAWNLYSAAVEFFPLLREKGHVGIVISHYGFDRALFDSLSKKMRLRHEAWYNDQQGKGDADTHLQRLTDWVVATGCGNHDVQNGLKWGTKVLMEDPAALLKDMYVVMESVRNGYSLLHDNLWVWLLRVVQFAESGPNKDPVAEYWRAIGVDADLVDAFCDVNPRWRGGVLIVDIAFEANPELMGKLSGLILYLFRFRKFTETRWTTLGEASRNLLGAMSVGLEGFVGCLRAQPSISDWHLHGFGRPTDEVKRFVAVVSMASFVPDSVLYALLEDDRVAGRSSELKALMKEEYQWLATLSTPFWNRVASVSGGAPSALRSDAVRTAVIAAGYITRKLFRVADELPWSLAEGDIADNLEKLATAPDIVEPVSRKIQALIRLGYNRAALVSAIELLKEVHWTTTGVEQGHGSAATMHRLHARYGAEQLAARSLVHMVRPMVPEGEEDARSQKVVGKIATLAKKVPQRVSGRHIFLRDLFTEAKNALPDGETLSQATSQSLLARHGAMYNRLSPASQSVYIRAAERHSAQAADSIGEEVVRLETQLQMHKVVVNEERCKQGVLMRLSHCKLTPEDLQTMPAMWEGNDFRGQSLERRRQRALAPPRKPDLIEQSRLNGCDDPGDSQCREAPIQSWARMVCWNREDFQNCCLTFSTGQDSLHYMFVYASQQPEFVALAPLTEIGAFQPHLGGRPFQQVLLAQKFAVRKKFRLNFGAFVFDREVILADDTQISVLPHLYFLRGAAAGSDADPMPFAEFTKGFVLRPAKEKAPSSSSGAKKGNGELLQQFPWLEGHFASKASSATGKSSNAARADATPPGDLTPALDDEAAEAAFNSLEQKRREWASQPVVTMSDFVTQIRGGAWAKQHVGTAADSVRAQGRGTKVQSWCSLHKLPKSATFSFALYGEQTCGILAREWCRRMQFWYDLNQGGRAASSEDRPAPAELPDEPAEFEALMQSSPAGSPAHQRGMGLRALRPLGG